MKFVKGMFLYVVFPVLMFAVGFLAGVEAMEFFYPGNMSGQEENIESKNAQADDVQADNVQTDDIEAEMNWGENRASAQSSQSVPGTGLEIGDKDASELIQVTDLQEVSAREETLSVDTKYVLEETDIINNTVVETTWKLPDQYVGMNREQFLVAMESYASFPPLTERERGFVGLEVLSFSRERVVVQMNYQYLQPTSSFYLAVRGNEVVVYLEDMETVYINTGMELEEFPEDIQLDIIQMLWIEDEQSLYNFLETYSS